MKRPPRIGVWNPTEPGPGAVPGLDARITRNVEWVALGPDPDPGHEGPPPHRMMPSAGPLPCHGLIIVTNGSLSTGTSAATSVDTPAIASVASTFSSILFKYRPSIQAQQLTDPVECEAFFERAAGIERIERLFGPDWRISDVVAFNARERFRAIVHDPRKHTLMGRIVAKAKDHPREILVRDFTELYLSALARPVTRRKHRSLFTHVAALLGDRLDESQQEALRTVIGAYASGEVGRAVPLEQLRQHILSLGVRGLETQSYLFPSELEAACIGLEPQAPAPSV